MTSADGNRGQMLRYAQPMQSQQVQRVAGYSSGDRSFAVSATSALSRLEPSRQVPPLQRYSHGIDERSIAPISVSRGAQSFLRPNGYANEDRVVGMPYSQTRQVQSSGVQQLSFPSGINTREHGCANSQLCIDNSKQSQPSQLLNGMQERNLSRPDSHLLNGMQGRNLSRPDKEPARSPASVQPWREQPTSRLGGYSIEKRGIGVAPTSPRTRQESFQERLLVPGTSANPSAISPKAISPKDLRGPLISGTCNPASSRSSWPPVKRPSPGRIEDKQEVFAPSGGIDLDEFLDSTNAIVPEVRPCSGDDDMMGDSLLNTLRSVSSFSKVDAEEMPQRMNERVETQQYNAAVYSLAEGAPAKESTCSEYDLDRENSNAAALLLCHTATPKLSLHPRGLRSVQGGPVSFATAAHPTGPPVGQKTSEVGGQNVSPNSNDPTEDVSFTWKILGAADKVVQFFSSLRPIEEKNRFASHSMRQTLPNPKRLQPNELFENRQRDQMRQAALSLKDAVTKLIAASGTTDAERATVRMPHEIRSRFARLRLRLVEAIGNGQQRRLDPSATASLERFISMCNYLAQADPAEVNHDVRQEFISFSQRHAQDLESHCRTLKWLEEDQRSRQSHSGGNISIVRVAGQVR